MTPMFVILLDGAVACHGILAKSVPFYAQSALLGASISCDFLLRVWSCCRLLGSCSRSVVLFRCVFAFSGGGSCGCSWDPCSTLEHRSDMGCPHRAMLLHCSLLETSCNSFSSSRILAINPSVISGEFAAMCSASGWPMP